jgi:cytochrome c-type protein NapC
MMRFILPAVLMGLALPAQAVDWARHKPKDMVLFYPGQLSWEMLLTQAEHSGADKFREGKDCRQCHEGEEAASGKLLVADKSSEKQPIAGKPGFIKAAARAAIEGDNLLIRLDFEPGAQPDAGQEPKFPLMAAVMIDDGAVAEAKRGGCYAMCHDNMRDMPSAAPGSEVTKYIARSRVKMSRAGGAEVKPTDQLDKFRAEGAMIEYWQAKLAPGAAPVVLDGAVLEKRAEHAVPIVAATASESNGTWSVVFSRKLNAGAGYKAFVPGKTYTLGFAVHAGHTAHRFHYVSLEKTLMLDAGAADLVAVRD